MYNQEQACEIERLCSNILVNIKNLNEKKEEAYFEYAAVLALLQKVDEKIDNTTRYAKPSWLPADAAWDERPSCDDFDPYVFTGTMSVQDFEMAQTKYFGGANMEVCYEK